MIERAYTTMARNGYCRRTDGLTDAQREVETYRRQRLAEQETLRALCEIPKPVHVEIPKPVHVVHVPVYVPPRGEVALSVVGNVVKRR